MGIEDHVKAVENGQFNERKTRPIFLSFLRIDNPDKLFARRIALKHSRSPFNFWINKKASDKKPCAESNIF